MSNISLFNYHNDRLKSNRLIFPKIHCIPNGLQYREPFFGNGSFGFNFLNHLEKAPNNIWINDYDPGISCLWTSIISFTDDFIKIIERYKPSSESAYDFYKEMCDLKFFPKEDNAIVMNGFKKLVVRKLAGKPNDFDSMPMKSDDKIKTKWNRDSIIKTITKISKMFGENSDMRIADDECSNLHPNDLIRNEDNKSFIFVNPPKYTNESDNSYYTMGDHQELVDLLKKTKHHWVLIYNSCKFIKSLYSWANIEEITIGNNKNPIMNRTELFISNSTSDGGVYENYSP
jgi:DNA adenine methylase